MVNQNKDPTLISDWTPIAPLISLTNCLDIDSPRPVPPNLRVVELSACWNGVKRSSTSLGVNPIPVSLPQGYDRGEMKADKRLTVSQTSALPRQALGYWSCLPPSRILARSHWKWIWLHSRWGSSRLQAVSTLASKYAWHCWTYLVVSGRNQRRPLYQVRCFTRSDNDDFTYMLARQVLYWRTDRASSPP